MKNIRTFEEWFFSKPKVSETAKEDCRKSIKSFLKSIGMMEADNMSDEQLIDNIRRFAKNKNFSEKNRLAWQLYNIAKPIL